MFRLDLLRIGVETINPRVTSLVGLLRLFFLNGLSFSNLSINLIFDLLKLLLRLLVVVSQDVQALSFMLYLTGIVVSFLLQAHGLSLVQAVSGGHEFVVGVLHDE